MGTYFGKNAYFCRKNSRRQSRGEIRSLGDKPLVILFLPSSAVSCIYSGKLPQVPIKFAFGHAPSRELTGDLRQLTAKTADLPYISSQNQMNLLGRACRNHTRFYVLSHLLRTYWQVRVSLQNLEKLFIRNSVSSTVIVRRFYVGTNLLPTSE